MGLGPLANALVQMELGESYLGALSMNTQGPDDATMLTLLAHGTRLPEGEVPQAAAQRREAHLLLDDGEGRRRRRHRHADARRPRRRQLGASTARSGSAAAPASPTSRMVMAKTNPDAPRHQQFSTFLVELPNPGYQIMRNITTMAARAALGEILGGGHAEIKIKDLVVPHENLRRRRGQRLQHGPAPPRLRPPAPRHAQRRDGAARARHGGEARARALDVRQAARRAPGRAVDARRLRERAVHRRG